jgi:hypothetical protein
VVGGGIAGRGVDIGELRVLMYSLIEAHIVAWIFVSTLGVVHVQIYLSCETAWDLRLGLVTLQVRNTGNCVASDEIVFGFTLGVYAQVLLKLTSHECGTDVAGGSNGSGRRLGPMLPRSSFYITSCTPCFNFYVLPSNLLTM